MNRNGPNLINYRLKKVPNFASQKKERAFLPLCQNKLLTL